MLHERCDQLYKELLEVEAVGKKAEEELKMTFVDQERLKRKMLIFINTWTKLRNKNNLQLLEKKFWGERKIATPKITRIKNSWGKITMVC